MGSGPYRMLAISGQWPVNEQRCGLRSLQALFSSVGCRLPAPTGSRLWSLGNGASPAITDLIPNSGRSGGTSPVASSTKRENNTGINSLSSARVSLCSQKNHRIPGRYATCTLLTSRSLTCPRAGSGTMNGHPEQVLIWPEPPKMRWTSGFSTGQQG